MTGTRTERLAEHYAELHAERERSWEPAKLARNIAQRRELVEKFNHEAIAQPGDRLDATITLVDVDSGEFQLGDLVAGGPAVLIFFRFAGCPACNLALPYYDRNLWPALDKAGIQLVAVSPQRPQGLKAIRERHQLGFRVASDPHNGLARRLGVAFVPSDAPQPTPGWIGELTGTGTGELPQPTILVIERDLTIRSIQVSPDWLVRPEADEILANLPEVEAKAVA